MTRQPTFIGPALLGGQKTLYDWGGSRSLGFNVPNGGTNILVFRPLPVGLLLDSVRFMASGQLSSVEVLLQIGIFAQVAQAQTFSTPISLLILPPSDGDDFSFAVDDENGILIDVPVYYRVRHGQQVIACQITEIGLNSEVRGVVGLIQGFE